jgi:hypothetical protein
LEDLSVDGRIKSECEETEWGCGLDRSGSEQVKVVDCCEHGNKHSSSIQSGEFD